MYKENRRKEKSVCRAKTKSHFKAELMALNYSASGGSETKKLDQKVNNKGKFYNS